MPYETPYIRNFHVVEGGFIKPNHSMRIIFAGQLVFAYSMTAGRKQHVLTGRNPANLFEVLAKILANNLSHTLECKFENYMLGRVLRRFRKRDLLWNSKTLTLSRSENH